MLYRGEESNTSRITELLRNEILSGRLHPGDKIESIRTLARRFSVSNQVFVSVFKNLAEEHLVVSKPKSGLFVAEKLPESLKTKRIAIGFLNRKMPLNEAFPLRCFCTLIRQAGKQDIQILLNSGEQEIPLQGWCSECRPDAVIATGKVDDNLVCELEKIGIPFMVLGNYQLSGEVSRLETDLASDMENKLLELMKQHQFRHLAAVLRKETAGSEAIKTGFRNAARKAFKSEDVCIFCETQDNNGAQALKTLHRKYGLDSRDLVFLTPDYFTGAAKYAFENKFSKKDLPFLLLDMPASEFIPYPELVGGYFYDHFDPLAEFGLECMLDIYYRQVDPPARFTVYGDGTLHLASGGRKNNEMRQNYRRH